MGILTAEAFTIRYTHHSTKGKSPGQTVFDQDMILPINHAADWRYIRQCKQAQIEKTQAAKTLLYSITITEW